MTEFTIVDENPWKKSLILSLVILVIGILLAVGGQGSLKIVLMISGVLILLASILMLLGSVSTASPVGIIICAIGIILGIALIAAPNFFSDIMMIVLAVVVIMMGLGSLLGGTATGSGPMMIVGMVIAVIMIAAGVLALLNPKETADVIMIIIGVMLIISGALGVYRALEARN
jgi:hypothetical protein